VKHPSKDDEQLPATDEPLCSGIVDAASHFRTSQPQSPVACALVDTATHISKLSRTLLCECRLQRLLLGWLQEAAHAQALREAGKGAAGRRAR